MILMLLSSALRVGSWHTLLPGLTSSGTGGGHCCCFTNQLHLTRYPLHACLRCDGCTAGCMHACMHAWGGVDIWLWLLLSRWLTASHSVASQTSCMFSCACMPTLQWLCRRGGIRLEQESEVQCDGCIALCRHAGSRSYVV